jgi:hypothetical protein
LKLYFKLSRILNIMGDDLLGTISSRIIITNLE